MIAKMRVKAVDYTKRIINNKVIKEIVMEMLPREVYLQQQLKEICVKCPLREGKKEYQKFTLIDWEDLDICRMQYFEHLLQSFVGHPGSEETKWLYSFLKICEECLRSSMDRPTWNTHFCLDFP